MDEEAPEGRRRGSARRFVLVLLAVLVGAAGVWAGWSVELDGRERRELAATGATRPAVVTAVPLDLPKSSPSVVVDVTLADGSVVERRVSTTGEVGDRLDVFVVPGDDRSVYTPAGVLVSVGEGVLLALAALLLAATMLRRALTPAPDGHTHAPSATAIGLVAVLACGSAWLVLMLVRALVSLELAASWWPVAALVPVVLAAVWAASRRRLTIGDEVALRGLVGTRRVALDGARLTVHRGQVVVRRDGRVLGVSPRGWRRPSAVASDLLAAARDQGAEVTDGAASWLAAVAAGRRGILPLSP